jgi:uncharacterized DUF497 family protein
VPKYVFIWDDQRNVPHLAEHGVTPEEAAHVIEHAIAHDVSRSSGDPVAFGYTPTGRHLMVAYWFVDRLTVYVETAYEVPPEAPRKRPRK